jgi:hypothetical protein
MGLGDAVHEALAVVGVTPERVEKLLGHDCGCEERRAKLNQLGWWAARVIRGRVERAKEYLEELFDDSANR